MLSHTKIGTVTFIPCWYFPKQKKRRLANTGGYILTISRHRRDTYTSLLTSGNLGEELSKFDAEVRNEVNLILARLIDERGITETLKAANLLRWMQEMNTAKHDAEKSFSENFI